MLKTSPSSLAALCPKPSSSGVTKMVVFAPVFALYAVLQLLITATLVDNPVNLPVARILRISAPPPILMIGGRVGSLVKTEWNILSFVSLVVGWCSLMVDSSDKLWHGHYGPNFLNAMHSMVAFMRQVWTISLSLI